MGNAELVTGTARLVVDYSEVASSISAAVCFVVFLICATVFLIYDRKKDHEALLDSRALELEKRRLMEK